MTDTSILDTINETMHLNRLQGATYEQVKNSFFANYLAALLLLRLQDIKGLMMINDPHHSKLTKFADRMSDVNFWGRALFYPNCQEVKSRLVPGHDKILSKQALKILDARIHKIMKVPLTAPEQIHWDDVIGSVLLLKHRFGLNSSYFTHITNSLYKWDTISDAEKKRTVNQAFMYLMQSDYHSMLLQRLRVLSSSIMIKGVDKVAQKIIGFRKLAEDDGGDATSTSAVASTSEQNAIVAGKGCATATTSQDMQSVLAGLYKLKKKATDQVTKKSGIVFKDGKIVKRKVKTFVARKFKAPDYLKVVKTKQGDK